MPPKLKSMLRSLQPKDHGGDGTSSSESMWLMHHTTVNDTIRVCFEPQSGSVSTFCLVVLQTGRDDVRLHWFNFKDHSTHYSDLCLIRRYRLRCVGSFSHWVCHCYKYRDDKALHLSLSIQGLMATLCCILTDGFLSKETACYAGLWFRVPWLNSPLQSDLSIYILGMFMWLSHA